MHQGELLFQSPMIEKDTPKSIRYFVNHIRTHIHSLKSLKPPVDTWDIPIILHILSNLNRNTRLNYERRLKSDDIPALNLFYFTNLFYRFATPNTTISTASVILASVNLFVLRRRDHRQHAHHHLVHRHIDRNH